MQALDLLLNRFSQPRLQEPAPEGDVLDNIMQAALRAPDHAGLAPWKFLVCRGEGLNKLGNIFEETAINDGMSEQNIERAPQLPLRAPMVIIAIAKYKEHEKVPRVEQIASTACSVHAMQMAAVAQGYSGIWRTGSYATSDFMKEKLGLEELDEIVGFLYLGTSVTNPLARPGKEISDFFDIWE